MAYRGLNGLSDSATENTIKIDASEQLINLPDNSYVRDADIVRDGMDLVLEGPNGSITIEGYFAAETSPTLMAPDGTMLTPELVNSFAQSNGMYANAGTMTDESPVGAVQEFSGEATVTRADGTTESINMGTPIFQGDIVETSADGAVNIVFVDETSFAVSEDARLAIDEFVFDASTNDGSQNFSVLKGVFVFTSGLIGREDPDDVEIDTPIGSIGIRGTIIAGDVDAGEITVVEGAIVLRDFNGNEMTLANQFETGRFDPAKGSIENMGELGANDVGAKFASVSGVSPSLFSSIQDAAQEGAQDNAQPDADGSVDQDNDGDVDSTINAETDTGEQADATDAPAEGETPPPPPAETTSEFGTNEFGDNPDGFGDMQQNGEGPAANGPAPIGAEGGQPPPPPGTGPIGPDGAVLQPLDQNIDPRIIGGNTGGTAGNTFSANVVATGINDDAGAGTVLATITGIGDDIASLTLQNHADKLDVVDLGSGTFEIQVKAGDTLDYDHLKQIGIINANDDLNIGFTAVSAGSESFSGNAVINVTPVNEAPLHFSNINEAVFTGVEGTTWHAGFDQDFIDRDFGDILNFTVSDVNLDGAGILANGLDDVALDTYLDRGAGTNGWDLTASGDLILHLKNGIANDAFITFDITATDSGGLDITDNYRLDILDAGNVNTAATNIFTDGGTYVLGDGGNTITLIDAATNEINLGNGDNTVTITADNVENVGNVILGGAGKDTFTALTSNNELIGRGGDDDFTFSAGAIAELEAANLTNFRIDGGHSDFNAGEALGTLTNPQLDQFNPFGPQNGRGDSLVIQSGDINFSAIRANGNEINGIERLDFATDTGANTVTLDYQDVVEMTDGHNTLILNLDGGDTLNFNDLGNGLAKVATNLAVNDAREGDAATDNFYDVYTNGDVTLLVDTDAGTVTGLPV